jgi:DNA-binding NarL/FixJ family response regulator
VRTVAARAHVSPQGGTEELLRILLIEDHALLADGLRLILGRLEREVHVEWAQSCEGALALLDGGEGPGLVLFDLALPGLHHLDAFRLLKERIPLAPIVAVSADERPRMIAELLRAGARGYIPKSLSAEIMLNALRLVLAGGTYVPEAALAPPTERANGGFTPRETDVLELLVSGHANKEMAKQLGMAESTVRVHVTSIMRRLGVASRVEVATSPVVRRMLRGLPERTP